MGITTTCAVNYQYWYKINAKTERKYQRLLKRHTAMLAEYRTVPVVRSSSLRGNS